jgi:hypothetical protein
LGTATSQLSKKITTTKVEGVVQDTADWREEKITFDSAYNNERMAAYLFLPKKVSPPFQTVVFFPSARVLDLSDSQTLGDTKFFDYYCPERPRRAVPDLSGYLRTAREGCAPRNCAEFGIYD